MSKFLRVLIFVVVSRHVLEAQTDKRFADLFAPTLEQIKTAQARLATTPTNQKDSLKQSIGDIAVDIQPYLLSLLDDYGPVLSRLERARIDKQLGAPPSASGATSVVSKGSVASLFSVAVENGALARDVSGTTVTFRGSPANILETLQKGDFLKAGPQVEWNDSFLALAKRASFHLSFDTARGTTVTTAANTSELQLTASRQQLESWGVRAEVINHRDPRHPRYRKAWQSLMSDKAGAYGEELNQVWHEIMAAADNNSDPWAVLFMKWRATLHDNVARDADKDVTPLLLQGMIDFRKLIDALPESSRWSIMLRSTAQRASLFTSERANLIDRQMRSLTAAIEYNYISQSNTEQTIKNASGEDVKLPNLENWTLVMSKGFLEGPELTFNAGWTKFSGGKTRDARAALDLSMPLADIKNMGKIVFSLSGQLIRLKQEPLGQKVQLLDKNITRTGDIKLFQMKLTIPANSGGVEVPIAFTRTNRTELLPDKKEWRLNLGLLFDMDKLAVKP